MNTKMPNLKTWLTAFIGATALLTSIPADATVLDLNAAPNGTGTINGAIFSINYLQPAGTGVIDPFLTIQNNGTEQGYNGANNNFDTKRVPQWNHEITLGSLAQFTLGGVQYYQFVVDVNEPNSSSSLISLDMLKIYTSSTIQSSTSVDANGIFNGSLGTLRYNLDGSPAGDSYVKYDDMNHGSGQADIAIFVPVSLFAGALATDYLYMYQGWGYNINADLTTQGGFEETFALTGVTAVPEVPAFIPLGAVLLLVVGVNYYRLRRKNTGTTI